MERKMKNRKVVDMEGRMMEVWKYDGMDRWNGLVKSEYQNVPGNYRGLSLRSTVCKMRREEGGYLEKDREQGFR